MKFISIAETIIALVIIALILLQERSSGLAGFLGGGDTGGFYQARRGMERVIFLSTIVLVAVFIALAVAQLMLT